MALSAAPRPSCGSMLYGRAASRMNCWLSAGSRRRVSSSAAENGPVMIDASAVLASLLEEPGADIVRDCLRSGFIGDLACLALSR